MIDIHCHILPQQDDGPRSWATTLEMCEKAANDGITRIVATPHCNSRYPFNRADAQRKVDALRANFPEIDFDLACELTISEKNLEEALANPWLFVIGSTHYLLVEANEAYLPKQVEDALNELLSVGLTPILVHPERNSLLRRRPDVLEEWISIGCLAALTGDSLLGFWGIDTRKAAETMLRQGLVQIMASDGHDPERRPPVLSEALKAAGKIVGSKRAHQLVWENPSAVVQGDPVLA